MAKFEETGPGRPVTEGIRVDKVHPKARAAKNIRAILVVLVAFILLVPVFVMALTAFKSRSDVVAIPPKSLPVGEGDVSFKPTLEGFVFLFFERTQLSEAALAAAHSAH